MSAERSEAERVERKEGEASGGRWDVKSTGVSSLLLDKGEIHRDPSRVPLTKCYDTPIATTLVLRAVICQDGVELR